MSSLSQIRSWQRRARLRTSSVLIAAWLNLVLQSCAMAVAPVDGCPHCPAEMTSLPGERMDCEQLNVADDPQVLVQVAKAPSPVDHVDVLDVPGTRQLTAATDETAARYARSTLAPFHDPPIHVLFGVYLN